MGNKHGFTNRENFLNKLAAKMGKARAIIPEPMDAPVNTYPTERLTHLSAVDLANEFINCENHDGGCKCV